MSPYDTTISAELRPELCRYHAENYPLYGILAQLLIINVY